MTADITQHEPDASGRRRLLGYGGAVAAVLTALFVAARLQPALDPEAPLLVAVLITAWFGGFRPALLATLLGTLAVAYDFSPPAVGIGVNLAHLPRLVMFAVLAVSFATVSAARRNAEHSLKLARDEMAARVRERTAELQRANEKLQAEIAERRQGEEAQRERAGLLDLTHDTVFVRDMSDVIKFWNRGAEEQYGWTRDEALGHVVHDLLRTVFPAPLDAITTTLEQTGRWEGELLHTRRDGTTIVVASRWALQSDAQGKALAVLETNRDITERKRAAQALEELAGRLINAQEEERSRIGRELHDHISQTLGVLTIKIDQLRASEAVAPAVGAVLDELRQDTSAITDDVHRLSHRLHSSTLDYLGLVPALQKLVSEFSDRHGIEIAFAHASVPAPLPNEVALCLFRVAEESLTNIAKHSKARSARVHLAGAPDGLHLTVQDAGEGFNTTSTKSRAGLGFVSMQERLRVLHGTIEVDSAPSRGTRIAAWVPPATLADAQTGTARRSEPA